MVDEGGHDFLACDAGAAHPVGGFALPEVEGAVLGRRQIDRSARPGLAQRDRFGRLHL